MKNYLLVFALLAKLAMGGIFSGIINPSGGGGSGVTSLGAVGSSPAAEGGSISGTTLTLQPEDATHPGLLSIGTQTIAGSKTLTGGNTVISPGTVNWNFSNASSGMFVATSTPINRLSGPATSYTMFSIANTSNTSEWGYYTFGSANTGVQAKGGGLRNENGDGSFPISWSFGNGINIGQLMANSTTLLVAPYVDANLNAGTSSVNASTAVTGSSTKFLQELGVGDQISVSSATSTFSDVTAIASDTALTTREALGNGTSQTIKKRKAIQRWDDQNANTVGLVDADGNFIVGGTYAAALATNATVGFPYIPTCAGTPTGTPKTKTGHAPLVIDSTNHKMYFYDNGTWNAVN